MWQQRIVNEFSMLDPDGGGNYFRYGKKTFYIEDQHKHRTAVKNLRAFLDDPSLADGWFLRPILGTNLWEKMLAPGARGGLMAYVLEKPGAKSISASNHWCLAINCSSYRAPSTEAHLRLYVFDKFDKVVRIKRLPLATESAAKAHLPELRLSDNSPRLAFRTTEGYMLYDVLADTLGPAPDPPPGEALLSYTWSRRHEVLLPTTLDMFGE